MNEIGIPFGMFFIVVAFVLMVLAFGRMLISRSYATRSWKISLWMGGAAFILFLIGILMLREGAGHGMGALGIGMCLILSGFLLIAIGVWQSFAGAASFWGALSRNNKATGLKFFMTGLLLIVGGIIIIALPEPDFQSRQHYNSSLDWYWLEQVFNKDIGGIPFGIFFIITKLIINLIGINKGLGLGQMVSINIVSLLTLILLYHMYPFSQYVW